MKTLLKTMILLYCALTLSSCDKIDDNGDLGGMWQLTEWKSIPDGTIMATKETAIYYSFQLDLMQLSRTTKHFARFSHKGDSLIIGKVYALPSEKEVTAADLATYGVPASGRFAIELSSSHMTLKSNEAILKFRKY